MSLQRHNLRHFTKLSPSADWDSISFGKPNHICCTALWHSQGRTDVLGPKWLISKGYFVLVGGWQPHHSCLLLRTGNDCWALLQWYVFNVICTLSFLQKTCRKLFSASIKWRSPSETCYLWSRTRFLKFGKHVTISWTSYFAASWIYLTCSPAFIYISIFQCTCIQNEIGVFLWRLGALITDYKAR